MNRSKLIIIFLGILIIAYNYLPDINPLNQSGTDKVAPLNTLSATDSYAYSMRPTDNKWPDMQTSQASVDNDLVKKNYYLVFDASGSMQESNCSGGHTKIDVAKQSVAQFISKIPGDANIGLVIFDQRGVYERAVLGNSSRDSIAQQINRAVAGGGTPLDTSIRHAYKALSEQAQKQLGYGEYHLIVITDGVASEGEDPSNTVQNLIDESPVVVHTIGFCISGSHSLNQDGLTLYKSANNPQELARGLDSVLAEVNDFNVDSFQDQQ